MNKAPFLALFVAWLVPLCLQAAQAPEWLAPFLNKEVRSWSKRPTVFLLNQVELRYTDINTCFERRLGAYQLNESNRTSGSRPPLPLHYRGDTDKILKLLVWTIAPDGKVKSVPRAALTESSSTSRTMRYSGHQLLYNIEELPTGTIIAWDFELERATGPLETYAWTPYRNIPVYKAVFSARPPPEGKILSRRFGAENGLLQDKGEAGLNWSLEKLRNPVGERPDGFLLTQNYLALRCLPKEGSHADSDDWEGLARADYTLFEERVKPTPELQAMAEKLVAGKTARWERIRALTDFVQKEITYLSAARESDYLAGFRPQVAAECLKNRFGDCKDKATLLKALLACIGEEAHPILLFAKDPSHVKPDWPANTFNHVITAIPTGSDAPSIYPIAEHTPLGRLVLVDGTSTTAGLGVLPLYDQLGHGLLCHPTKGGLFQIPGDSEATLRKISTTIRFDEAGQAGVERTELSEGLPATTENAWSNKVAAELVRRTLEGRYSSTGNTISGLSYTLNWEPEKLRHVVTVNFQAGQLLRKAAKNLFLINPLFAHTAAPLPPWNTEATGVALQPFLCIDEEVLIELPPNYVLGEAALPEIVRSEKAQYLATLELTGRTLRVHTRYTQQAGLYSKTEYNHTRELRQRWLAAQKRPVVLSQMQEGKSDTTLDAAQATSTPTAPPSPGKSSPLNQESP